MKLLSYKCCRGIQLLRLGRFTIEAWLVPANFKIEEHYHPSEDNELLFLYGDARFVRNRIYSSVARRFRFPVDFLASAGLKAGDSHYFETFDKPLLFLNFARWYKEPTSANVDFQPVKN